MNFCRSNSSCRARSRISASSAWNPSFAVIGAVSAIALYWVGRGDWFLALTLFVIGNIGVASSIVFYESLLPHLVDTKDLDRVSSAGYATGYLGGGVLLAINLLMIQKPEWFGIPDTGTGVRLALASVGIWWLVFSIPLFLRVPEPPAAPEAGAARGGNLQRCVRELDAARAHLVAVVERERRRSHFDAGAALQHREVAAVRQQHRDRAAVVEAFDAEEVAGEHGTRRARDPDHDHGAAGRRPRRGQPHARPRRCGGRQPADGNAPEGPTVGRADRRGDHHGGHNHTGGGDSAHVRRVRVSTR